VLDQLDLPPEMTGVGGSACLAEEAAVGAQVTIEGFSFHGDVRVYGVVNSIHSLPGIPRWTPRPPDSPWQFAAAVQVHPHAGRLARFSTP
jgi:hypothetical protein